MYGYYGYGLYDPTMILVLIGAVLSLWASAKVKNTFNRYSSVRSMTGMTGAEAAQRLLNSQGIYDVTVRPVSGQLTDHYDPRTKTGEFVRWCVFFTSVAAIGVAAHECGHAIQDNVRLCASADACGLCPGGEFWKPAFLALDSDRSSYRRKRRKHHCQHWHLDVCTGGFIPVNYSSGRA